MSEQERTIPTNDEPAAEHDEPLADPAEAEREAFCDSLLHYLAGLGSGCLAVGPSNDHGAMMWAALFETADGRERGRALLRDIGGEAFVNVDRPEMGPVLRFLVPSRDGGPDGPMLRGAGVVARATFAVSALLDATGLELRGGAMIVNVVRGAAATKRTWVAPLAHHCEESRDEARRTLGAIGASVERYGNHPTFGRSVTFWTLSDLVTLTEAAERELGPAVARHTTHGMRRWLESHRAPARSVTMRPIDGARDRWHMEAAFETDALRAEARRIMSLPNRSNGAPSPWSGFAEWPSLTGGYVLVAEADFGALEPA